MVTEVQTKLSDRSTYEINSPNTTMAIRGTITVTEVDYELPGKSKFSLGEVLAGLDAAFERCVADIEGYLTCKRTNEMFANPDMAWWFERNNRKISTDLNYNFILSDKINSLNEADKSAQLIRDKLRNI